MQNSALISAISGNKLKKRKLSSAQSKSPEAASIIPPSAKLKIAPQAVVAEPAPEEMRNIAMTLINQAGGKTAAGMTAAEEKKVDIAPVTFFSPTEKVAPQPQPAKEETKKEIAAAAAVAAVAAIENASKRSKPFEIYPVKLANKIEDNFHLTNKKALFVNMKNYYEAIGEDPFAALPVTFHIKEGLDDPNFIAFKQYYEDHRDSNNIWITKPGECTNRGVGI